MAPWSTTSGVPSPTIVQAISISPTGTVLVISRMTPSWVRTADRSVGKTVSVEPGCKVKTVDPPPGWRVYRGGVRISQLADEVGVPVSTVRYYERIGLMAEPGRTVSGYREYDVDSATQLLFIT